MNAHLLGTTEFCIHWIPLGGQCISQFCCVSYVSPLHLCTHKLWLPEWPCSRCILPWPFWGSQCIALVYLSVLLSDLCLFLHLCTHTVVNT